MTEILAGGVESHSLDRGLQLRLRNLTQRISTVRRKMKEANGIEKIEELGELRELERRHAALKRRIMGLDRAGPGFRRNIRAELARMADDIMGTAGEFMIRLDSYVRWRGGAPTEKP